MQQDAASRRRSSIADVVEQLCNGGEGMSRTFDNHGVEHALPSRNVLVGVVEKLRAALFPGYFGKTDLTSHNARFHVGSVLDEALDELEGQVVHAMCFGCCEQEPDCPVCRANARIVIDKFLSMLPEIRRMLATDVRAAYEGDPAATSPDEAILCYPGILAVTNYRIAHELYRLGVPLLPRMITELAHGTTGIDIHPGASIGESFFIDHGTGVVIGETCIIGKRVRIYQGVTLGAKSFPLDDNGNPIKGIPRHPIVEDDVIIYGGATILGRVTIGRGSTIGGNVWLTESVPPYTRVTQARVRHEHFEQGGGI